MRPLPTLISLLTVFSLAACSSTPAPKKITDKEKANMLLEVAAACISEGDNTGALGALNQVHDINDKIPEEHYFYALAYYRKGEPQMAIDSARKAIALRPTYSEAKNTLGKLLLDQGKYTEAEKWLLESAHDLLFREAYLAKTNLGVLYYKTTKLDQAKYWLTAAIKDAGPAACVASYYRGQIELNQNDFDRAQIDLKAATRSGCSGMSDSHLALGQAFIRMKKYDQARAKFLEIKQLFPESDASNKASVYLREIP